MKRFVTLSKVFFYIAVAIIAIGYLIVLILWYSSGNDNQVSDTPQNGQNSNSVELVHSQMRSRQLTDQQVRPEEAQESDLGAIEQKANGENED